MSHFSEKNQNLLIETWSKLASKEWRKSRIGAFKKMETRYILLIEKQSLEKCGDWGLGMLGCMHASNGGILARQVFSDSGPFVGTIAVGLRSDGAVTERTACRHRHSSSVMITVYQRSPTDDPQGSDGAQNRVIRGGSWNDGPRRVKRSAFRGRDVPRYRSNDLGFRLARIQSVR